MPNPHRTLTRPPSALGVWLRGPHPGHDPPGAAGAAGGGLSSHSTWPSEGFSKDGPTPGCWETVFVLLLFLVLGTELRTLHG